MLVLASSPRTTSRLGASMISLSAPPASIGKRTAPPPTVKLVTRSGALAARKSAAAVPLWPEDVGQGLLHGGHGRIFADRALGGLLTRNARGNAPSHAAACRSAARPTRPASAARLRLPRRLRCSSRVAPGTPDRWPSPARSATPQWAPARNRRSVLSRLQPGLQVGVDGIRLRGGPAEREAVVGLQRRVLDQLGGQGPGVGVGG